MFVKSDIPDPKIRKFSKGKPASMKRKTKKSVLAANNSTIENEILSSSVNLRKISKKLHKLAGERHHTKVFEMNEQVNEFLKEAFTVMGQPDLYHKIQWRWNKKLTSTIGMAYYVWATNFAIPTHIELSPLLFLKAPIDERKQTIFHEVAHVVDYYTGNFDRHAPHGPSWRSLMIMAGMKPERCHNVKIEQKLRKQKWVHKAKCECKDGIQISKILYSRIRQGVKYLCRKCKKEIIL